MTTNTNIETGRTQMSDEQTRMRTGGGRCSTGVGAVALSLVVTLLTGCEVTNPGPVQDEFLNDPVAHASLVHGAAAELALTVNYNLVATGHAAREIYPSGQSTPGGLGPVLGAGHFEPTNMEAPWVTGQKARWIAEDALQRFTSSEEAVDPVTFARAYLIAGYANKHLGENFCDAIFDGGPREPNIRYFERAEMHFTNAVAQATGDALTAAYAGRAATRVWLKKWTEATSDTERVPLDFVYSLSADMTTNLAGSTALRNSVYLGNANDALSPYRSQTIHFTWFYDYYEETGDPRSAWEDDPEYPVGTQSLVGFPGGRVPWSYSLKYTSYLDPFRLASGHEMVLIRAEALLDAGQWPEAMTLINSLRTAVTSDKTGQPLEPWPANSLDEAWTALKRERAVVMWLESRRMGDLRRWKENNVPGEIDWPDWESTSVNFINNPPSDCISTGQIELDANPNL